MDKTLAELEEEHMALEANMDTINDDIMRVEEEIQKLEGRTSSRFYKAIYGKDIEREYGVPCKDYASGCVVCKAWDVWEVITEGKIKYRGHDDVVCECVVCVGRRVRPPIGRESEDVG